MFVTSNKINSPRVFQKPNILRKKPKAKEKSPPPLSVPESVTILSPPKRSPENKRSRKHRCSKPCHSLRKGVQRIQLDSYLCEEYRIRKLLAGAETTLEPQEPAPCVPATAYIGSSTEQGSNEADICTSQILQEKYIVNLQNEYNITDVTENVHCSSVESERCSTTGDSIIQLSPYTEFDTTTNCEPQLGSIPFDQDSNNDTVNTQESSVQEASSDSTGHRSEALVIRIDESGQLWCPIASCKSVFLSHQELTQHLAGQHSNTHECDFIGCGKSFWNAESLQRHSATHDRSSDEHPPRQMIIDCPARRLKGEPPMCEAVFKCRDDLVRHLKEDHTDEDALYKCDTCGRSFFWYSGLRAHMRVHASTARAIYACPWPGCSRVFLQACRLKEHSRAHTGDKPYPCLYPSCGWAFRTASKLVRHKRRHTGERRFKCRLCSRAFLRAEHLREHEARHTHPLLRRAHICTVPGCEQRFTNKSSLYCHTKKMHPKPRPPSPPPSLPSPLIDFSVVEVALQYTRPQSVVEEAERSARTHVTWPLSPGAHLNSPASDDDTLEAEAQRATGVYTVRRDLFLHGNAAYVHDESQNGMEAGMELVLLPREEEESDEAGAAGSAGATAGYGDSLHLDTDLGLLDSAADPINHLLQDELMLADTDVDELPFQVLLLSGNEADNTSRS